MPQATLKTEAPKVLSHYVLKDKRGLYVAPNGVSWTKDRNEAKKFSFYDLKFWLAKRHDPQMRDPSVRFVPVMKKAPEGRLSSVTAGFYAPDLNWDKTKPCN